MVDSTWGMGTGHHDRASRIRKERALDGPKVHFFHKSNEAVSFSEVVLPSPSVGTKSSFPACLGRFRCTANVSRNLIIKHQQKVDYLSFYCSQSTGPKAVLK